MDRCARPSACPRARLPRTRGDGPQRAHRERQKAAASPHTRGWTREAWGVGVEEEGFPAHAGMDPWACCGARSFPRLPRTRGDGPAHSASERSFPSASPHTRGWTLGVLTAKARMKGFPAHAGMDRRQPGAGQHAAGLPRTRGDGPSETTGSNLVDQASPHTRGWTFFVLAISSPVPGFPAHAGMDPMNRSRSSRSFGLPRTRGDGPRPTAATPTGSSASPHTRGWTLLADRPQAGQRGFPAHAGMDPQADPDPASTEGLPRTRGDGP